MNALNYLLVAYINNSIQRINYKVASITYNARSTKSPPYLQSILQDYIPGRAVPSASRILNYL